MAKISKKSVSFTLLEAAIYNKDYPAVEQILSVLIHGQVNGKLSFNLPPTNRTLSKEQKELEAFQIIEKLALLLTNLFSDEKYIASEKMFNEFVLTKRFISYVFSASSYKNTDHIVQRLGLNKKQGYSTQDIRRLLMIYMPESTFDLPWVKLANHMPSEVCRAYLGLMSSVVLLMSETSTKQLNALAAVAKSMPSVRYKEPENLALMTSGYFHVSNLTGEDKYEFKKWAVANYQNFMEDFLSSDLKKKIAKKVLKKPKKAKQTIVIIHEHYRKKHAMYRCKHSMNAALKHKFNVVGFAHKEAVDELGKQDHHDFFEYENTNDISKIILDILDVQPDIVFYPSIGMSNFVPLLATQRLAPIQCMSGGHPASSMMPNIDYFIYNNVGVENNVLQKFFTETLIDMKFDMQPMSHDEFVIETIEQADNVFRICINGVLPKVTHEIIDVCRKITQGTEKLLEFQFFVGSHIQDLEYYAAKSMLRRYLPNSKVHLYQNYNSYMNVLAKCQLALPTIPFGGSNSNMDCLRLNLPKLYIVDERSFVGYTDSRVWGSLGIENGFCSSVDELVSRTIKLIDSPDLLNELKASLSKFDINLYNSKVGADEDDSRLANTLLEIIK